MRRRVTPEILARVADLQKKDPQLSIPMIAMRLGVHPQTLHQAIRKVALGPTNKYKAKSADGFPSQLEKSVYELLLLREKAKEIRDIKRQVRVELTRAAIAVKIDFSFTEVATGRTIYCEAKGVETERWRIIKKIWAFYGPAPLEVFKGTHGRPQLIETVRSKGYV